MVSFDGILKLRYASFFEDVCDLLLMKYFTGVQKRRPDYKRPSESKAVKIESNKMCFNRLLKSELGPY